jgi:hypothetical protein
MAIPNPITAVVAFLKADAEVTTQVGTKVFGAELPDTETTNMPQKCLVVAPAGGPGGGLFGNSRMQLNRIRVDIKGYGTTPETSWDVYHSAYDALKQLVQTKQGTVLLEDASVAGGPVQLRDNDLEWPLVMGSFEVVVAEVAV